MPMRPISRRDFVKASLLASATLPLAGQAQPATIANSGMPGDSKLLPQGRIGGIDFTRLILGGNLLAGYAHSRDLPYVSTLMRRYNTPQKVLETLELAERNGIGAINTWVQDDNSQLFAHWK